MNHDIHLCSCPEHTALKIENLSVKINDLTILDNISCSFPRGLCTAIVGPNGAGKSTLVKAILNLVKYSGSVKFGTPSGTYTPTAPRWGYVPQKLQFDRAMPVTVMEFLAAQNTNFPVFLGVKSSLKKKIMEMLDSLEAAYLADRQLGQLSGGELQRVLLAGALLRSPEIVLLDEPAAGVDFQGEKLCCELLDKFRKKHDFTQILISHDLATVAAHAAHVICLKNRVIASGHPAKVLTEKNLRAAFGLHTSKVDLPDHSEVCSCSKH